MYIDSAIKLAGESPISFIIGAFVFGLLLIWIGWGTRKGWREMEKMKAELAEKSHAVESFKVIVAKQERDLDILADLLHTYLPEENIDVTIIDLAIRSSRDSSAKERLERILAAVDVLGYRVSLQTRMSVENTLPQPQPRSPAGELAVHRPPGGTTDWQLPSDDKDEGVE